MAEPWLRKMSDHGRIRQGHSLTGDPNSFLTPRGLWLQQNGRVDLPMGAPLPSTIPGNDSRQWMSDDQGFSTPAEQPLLGRFDDRPLDAGTLQNLRPAERYPNPAKLRSRPLTPLYVAALANEPIWTSPESWPAGYTPNQADLTGTSNAIGSVAKAIGKIVIRLPGKHAGQVASGSAFVTGPNTIMTCAHNLFDSNERQWSQGLEFYPGYDFYSSNPLPACRVISGVIPAAYLENPLTNHDIAICRVDCNIGELVGTELAPFQIDNIDFYDRHWVDIMGYPAGSGFDFGKQLWRSRGRFLFGVSGGGEDEYAPAIATHFGGGASGCPWVHFDTQRQQHVAVGVTSGHARLRYDTGEPNLMSLTSALFTGRNLERLDDAFIEHTFA